MRKAVLWILLAISARADTACVGFTGAKCDRSYPPTELGIDCAMWERPLNSPVTIYVGGPDVYVLKGLEFCDDDEFRAYVKDGKNWLPWKRYHVPAVRINRNTTLRTAGFTFGQSPQPGVKR